MAPPWRPNMLVSCILLVSFLISVPCPFVLASDDVGRKSQYLIGSGIYDVTGPAAQINFMGYAKAAQNGRGIHLRLRARAFIMAEVASDRAMEIPHKANQIGVRRHRGTEAISSQTDPERAVCFVSADIGMGSDLLTMKVVQRLEELLPKHQGGKRLCHLENLSISATHTHSAPGGFLQYVLYQITGLGYSEEAMGAYVEGIAQSIYRAYQGLTKGEISHAEALLFNSNINRSPSSYLLNPEEERRKYAKEGNTDKRMLQLRFTSRPKGEDIGILNWFSVHATSMNNTNRLISSDNKGYASYLMEKHQNGNTTLPGYGKFVAAFASTNLGDVSPNTKGAFCVDTGLPCDYLTSTCAGVAETCVASGPGDDMFQSTEIIGRKQFEMAQSLLSNSSTKFLNGSISSRHSFINMGNVTVALGDGTLVTTCPAALGYGFGSGTTDGSGFDFTQGSNASNPFWDMVFGFVSRPTEEQIKCHHPKPIMLNTGAASEPYDWDPKSIPISIFKVGQLFILNVPMEMTTMAGRRLREAVAEIAMNKGVVDPIITIAGLANSYTHYVTTFEEYQGQRYEAASTLFGPYTLSAYIQEFTRITTDLLNDNPSTSAGAPLDLTKKQISLIPPVFVDTIAVGRKFGSVVEAPKDQYTIGQDTVFVSFRSANPRNNRRPQGTFMTVDNQLDDGSWQTVFVDGDWCTKYVWNGEESMIGISFAEISWEIPAETSPGLYRICHYGARRKVLFEVEALAFWSPNWMSVNALGSAFTGFLVSGVKLYVSLCKRLNWCRLHLETVRIEEFSGCSDSFHVKAGNSTGF